MAARRHPKANHVLRRCVAACGEPGLGLHCLEAASALGLARALAAAPAAPAALASASCRGSHSFTAQRDAVWALLDLARTAANSAALGEPTPQPHQAAAAMQAQQAGVCEKEREREREGGHTMPCSPMRSCAPRSSLTRAHRNIA